MFMVRDSDGRLEELGRVYVYLQIGPLELAPQLPYLTGTQIFSRFGSSITPLGDLNQDGFNGEDQSLNSYCSLFFYSMSHFLFYKYGINFLTSICLICNIFSISDHLDIAISSPFGGKDEQGVVSIYNGYAKGLRDKPSQVISGQWSSAAPPALPSGFGFSMKGGKDLDQNGYPGE